MQSSVVYVSIFFFLRVDCFGIQMYTAMDIQISGFLWCKLCANFSDLHVSIPLTVWTLRLLLQLVFYRLATSIFLILKNYYIIILNAIHRCNWFSNENDFRRNHLLSQRLSSYNNNNNSTLSFFTHSFGSFSTVCSERNLKTNMLMLNNDLLPTRRVYVLEPETKNSSLLFHFILNIRNGRT